MRIFVRSLPVAARRRSEAARQLAGFRLEFEFFDAVARVKEAFTYFDGFDRRLYKLNTGRSPLPGEIGCFASHKALWQACVELNEPVVVLEDDFYLGPNFAEVITNIESLINTYGFVRLQSYRRARKKIRLSRFRNSYPLPKISGCRLRYLSNVPLGLIAYALSPKAAAALVESSRILDAPADKFLQKTWVHSTPIFGLDVPIVSHAENGNPSMIGVRQQKSRNIFHLIRRLVFKGVGEIRRGRFDREQIIRLQTLNTRENVGRSGSGQYSALINHYSPNKPKIGY